MLYTHDGKAYSWSDEFTKKNANAVPRECPVWAFAYDVNNDTTDNRLRCEPIEGEVKKIRSVDSFVPYKKNAKGARELRKSGIVNVNSRYYADSLPEAVRAYNGLIQERIEVLKKMAEEAEEDKIWVM